MLPFPPHAIMATGTATSHMSGMSCPGYRAVGGHQGTHDPLQLVLYPEANCSLGQAVIEHLNLIPLNLDLGPGMRLDIVLSDSRLRLVCPYELTWIQNYF